MNSFSADQILLDQNLIHLNHAGVGPWLRCTVDAIREFAMDNAQYGTIHLKNWEATEHHLRKLSARLVNAASTDDIAFLKNTSEGLSMVAYGYTWQPGDNVVFAQQEFPSNRVVWESLASKGVEARRVNLAASSTPENALIDAMDAHTRILAVSAVQYGNGLRMNLQTLAHHCRLHHCLLCVDAIQALGVLPLDVQQYNIDIAVADAHKWLLSPEGIAIFYISPSARQVIKPTQFGWHNLHNPGDYDTLDWQVAQTAKRYECGSLNNLGMQGLQASLATLLDIGIDTIHAQVGALVNRIISRIDTQRYEILTPLDPSRRAGIVTLHHRSQDNKEIFMDLLRHQILCAYRAGGIRLSPHFYTPSEQIDFVIEKLNRY